MVSQVSIEEIADEFDEFGEEVGDDLLERLQSLCQSYSADANSIVNQWMAFSSSRKLNMSFETLDAFDREWLSKKLQSSAAMTPKAKNTKSYNHSTCGNEGDENEILSTYSTPNAKTKGSYKRQITPNNGNQPQKKLLGSNRSPVPSAPISPCISPGWATPSAKFSSRTNAGEVILTFGPSEKINWHSDGQACNVKYYELLDGLGSRTKYMFQKLSDKACVMDEFLDEQSEKIKKDHGIEEFSHVALPSQEAVTVVGRICCDSIGRLNSQSVILEGSRGTSSGKCISLDLSELKQFSFFPGQIVALDGVNITGKSFAVQKVYDSKALPFAATEYEPENGGKVRIVIATGPYAPCDGLDYSPLEDLIKYIHRDKPDLCFFMGPFVDVKNNLINNGEVDENYEELFTRQMEQIGNATKNIGCKVVIVPSSRDIHHCHYVYPQPLASVPSHRPDGSQKLQSELDVTKHMMFVPDPCTLNVNGAVIGLTSTDILMHLTKSEISMGSKLGLDRMGRLAQHILHQQTYYPLYPPAEDMNVDFELWESHARLPVTPHVLLIPSDLKAFIKDIDGCCCINPGRVTTGQAGGTYAKLVIDTHALKSNTPLPSSSLGIVGQIVKV